MRIDETAKVLAKIRLIDDRTVDEGVILAWHDVIGELEFEDAIAAVDECRRYLTTRLYPAHVMEEAAEQRADRERENGTCTMCGAIHRSDRKHAVLCASCDEDEQIAPTLRAIGSKDARTYVPGGINLEEQALMYEEQSARFNRSSRALGREA